MNSRFEYVRQFEQHPTCVPDTWIVCRVDGRCFHRLTSVHNYAKPNDDRGLALMNACAMAVMEEFGRDIIMAFGDSDEFSFVLGKTATLFGRRYAKVGAPPNHRHSSPCESPHPAQTRP
jgi:tRNA(His) guanylyltransferase